MSKLKKAGNLILFLLGILGITIFQDYLQSNYQDYAFYFSESLLFNLFWPLIIPVTLLLRVGFKNSKFISRMHSNWWKRVLFIFLATGIHLTLFAVLVHVVSGLFYEHTFRFLPNLGYSLSQDLYKYLLIYTAISLFPIQKKEVPNRTKPSQAPDFLLLSNGKKTEKISIASIHYLAAATPYVEVFTEEKKYLQQGSLRSFSERLDSAVFVRIHKTTLVNVRKVDSISSRGNGDYDLRLLNGQVLRLSRNYAQEFRRRFEENSTA